MIAAPFRCIVIASSCLLAMTPMMYLLAKTPMMYLLAMATHIFHQYVSFKTKNLFFTEKGFGK